MRHRYSVLLIVLLNLLAVSVGDDLAQILPAKCGYKGFKLLKELRQLNRAKRAAGDNKIAGGTSDLIKSHPWQAALVTKEKEHQCGGSVVSKYHVLTAAHCFFVENTKTNTSEGISPDERLIVVSSASPTENGLYYEILYLHLHAKYAFSWGGYDNDIALIQIKGEFAWTAKVFPICLPESSEQYTSGRSCIISGYGEDGLDTTVGLLKFGEVEVKSDQECREKYASSPTAITENMFCAGGQTFDEGVIDSCKGDSGGPLYCQSGNQEVKHVLLGVTSFGVTCGQKRPGVYVKITKFLPWIHDKLKIAEIPAKVPKIQPPVSETNLVSNRTWRNILPENCGLRGKKLKNFITKNATVRVRRVANGEFAEIESHPWQVALIDLSVAVVCGGSIISDYHILTAASCFFRRDKKGITEVGLNERRVVIIGSELGKKSQYFNIDHIFLHKFYERSNGRRNNIAVIKIHEGFKFSDRTFPICLPRQNEPYEVGRVCLISGHGFESKRDKNSEMTLSSGKVKIQSVDYCERSYDDTDFGFTDAMICANGGSSHKNRVDACVGDKGGALQCADSEDKYFLMGINSFGNGCGTDDYHPTVYTKITKYLDWIFDVLEASMGYRTRESLRPSVDIGKS